MGVEKEIIRPGNGPKPSRGQKVTVHCTGFENLLLHVVLCFSTKDPGQQPFSFNIGKGSVIKGIPFYFVYVNETSSRLLFLWVV
ncbi:Peptidyl-prolyl cis-trans isomerase FKBP12 [Linum grandiflorum]